MELKWVEGSDVYAAGKQDHTTNIRISHVVLTLKLLASKGYPMRLEYMANYWIRPRRQEYKPSPPFPLNAPTNPCPKVSMISKQNYSTKPMKNHTYRVKRPIFKHAIITDGRGTTRLVRVVKKMAHRAIKWLQWFVPAEDHLREKKNLLGISPTKRWVTKSKDKYHNIGGQNFRFWFFIISDI